MRFRFHIIAPHRMRVLLLVSLTTATLLATGQSLTLDSCLSAALSLLLLPVPPNKGARLPVLSAAGLAAVPAALFLPAVCPYVLVADLLLARSTLALRRRELMELLSRGITLRKTLEQVIEVGNRLIHAANEDIFYSTSKERKAEKVPYFMDMKGKMIKYPNGIAHSTEYIYVTGVEIDDKEWETTANTPWGRS